MNTERMWSTVNSTSFTADGQENGVITVQDTGNFKVKMRVTIQSDTLQPTNYEVKRVISRTQMALGLLQSKHKERVDLTKWLLVDNSIVKANEQVRPSIDRLDYERAVYEEEPTMAKRAILVDKYGNTYDKDNPFPSDIVAENIDISLPKPNIRTIQIVTVNDTNEFQHILPNNTKKYIIIVRDSSSGFRIAFNSGETNDGVSEKYVKIRRGNFWESPDLDLPNNTSIYIKSDKTNAIFQIVSYQIV